MSEDEEAIDMKVDLPALLSDFCRDRYLRPPHYNAAFSAILEDAVSKYAISRMRKQEGSINVDIPSHFSNTISGSVVQPLEFHECPPSFALSHCVNRLERMVTQLHDSNGSEIADMEFGTAVWSSGARMFIYLGMSWVTPSLARRRRRRSAGLTVTLHTLTTALVRELQTAKISLGRSGKYSQEFENAMKTCYLGASRGYDMEPPLPALFDDCDILQLKYDAGTHPEDMLDHAIEHAIPHVALVEASEFDPHFAIVMGAPSISSSSRSLSADDVITIYVARLWRNRLQALQVLPQVPFQLDSRTLESRLRENVSHFQGFDLNVWSSALSHQLFALYASQASVAKPNGSHLNDDSSGYGQASSHPNTNKTAITLPPDCDWVTHTAFTFHNWPVKAILAFVSSNSTWSAPGAQRLSLASLKCALCVLPSSIPSSSAPSQSPSLPTRTLR